MMMRLSIVVVLLAAGPAHADWPCTDGARTRIARSPKGDKPIAIGSLSERPTYGDFTFVELNSDGRQDVIFHSACIRGTGDSVKLHRVYAACSADEYVQIFEEEELCTRTVAIATDAHATKAGGAMWQDLKLVRTIPGKPCEQATQTLAFDGARYQSGPRTTKPCTKPR